MENQAPDVRGRHRALRQEEGREGPEVGGGGGRGVRREDLAHVVQRRENHCR